MNIGNSFQGHRCAVCWERQGNHADWYEHVVRTHGIELATFDYDVCEHNSNTCPKDDRNRLICDQHVNTCPGIAHDKRLPNLAVARMPRHEPEPQPIKTADGTIYTPQPLFGDQVA